MNRPVLVAKAWPYANGSMHVGHVAALLPADVIARYFRLQGDDVLFVSGTDCHGTPILNRAADEGKTPEEIAEFYHSEFTDHFQRLSFSHDLYSRTHRPEHVAVVQQFFSRLKENGFLTQREVPQLYCPQCRKILLDRFVEGNCPECGAAKARGDQCDACGATYDAVKLGSPICAKEDCRTPAVRSHSKHFLLNLPALQESLQEWFVEAKLPWRENAQSTTQAWLERGLEERVITRDISWGIPLPEGIEGYEVKVIYVWFEAVLGYLSASIIAAGGSLETGGPWEKWWRPENNPLHYYVHGKDNIPFHTIIWPAILMGYGNLALPTHIVSSDFINLSGGQKFSKTNKSGTDLPTLFKLMETVPGFCVDSIRFFLLYRGPEERDVVFTWDEVVKVHNELTNKFANLVSRVKSMIEKNFDNRFPGNFCMKEVMKEYCWVDSGYSGHEDFFDGIDETFKQIGKAIESGHFRDACTIWMREVERANGFLDKQKPWSQLKTDIQLAQVTLSFALHLIYNLGLMIEPFLPDLNFRLLKVLGIVPVDQDQSIYTGHGLSWGQHKLSPGFVLGPTTHLLERIDRKLLPADAVAEVKK